MSNNESSQPGRQHVTGPKGTPSNVGEDTLQISPYLVLSRNPEK